MGAAVCAGRKVHEAEAEFLKGHKFPVSDIKTVLSYPVI